LAAVFALPEARSPTGAEEKMKSLGGTFRSEIEVRRSRFLAYAVPFGEFARTKERLRDEHPKAGHIAWAWRHINEYDHIVESSADDGEPRGCAGPPILGVMRGMELIDAAILVVRYFGGIRLGTGGMARAYSAASRAVIDAAQLQAWEKLEKLVFRSDYSDQRQIHYLLDRLGIGRPVCRYEETGIIWEVEMPVELIRRFLSEADRLIDIR